MGFGYWIEVAVIEVLEANCDFSASKKNNYPNLACPPRFSPHSGNSLGSESVLWRRHITFGDYILPKHLLFFPTHFISYWFMKHLPILHPTRIHFALMRSPKLREEHLIVISFSLHNGMCEHSPYLS